MPPTTIGRYQILRSLGSGGMATVYLAHDPMLDRQVAVKVPDVERQSADALARFHKEATAVARLEHHAIVPLYEYGDQGGRSYLIMRYMPGGSLDDRIARRPLALAEAIPIIDHIAAALDYAHAHGVFHRDVKPGNILFDEAGAAYLTDFGIARLAGPEGGQSLTKTGLVVGTVAYMSPEQALGKPLDGRADIYSLGVTLYEMLAGDIPYQSESQLQLAMQHVSAPIPDIRARRPDLPPATQSVIERALAKEPAQRYQTAAALAADLRRVAGGGRPLRQAAPPPARKKGTPAWLLAGGLALVGLLAAFLLLRPVSSAPPARATPAALAAESTPDRPAAPSGGQPTDETSLINVAEVEAEPQASSTPADTPTPTPTPRPATPTTSPTALPDRGPEQLTIGRTDRGTPIQAFRFGAGPAKIFFIGGLHAGFAPGTVQLANLAVSHFSDHADLIPDEVTLYVVISASPDTAPAPGELAGRLNSNGVDANRNWDCRWAEDAKWRGQVIPGSGGPAPFSEPEVQSLADFIVAENPVAVVFWEARAENGLVSPGSCGTRTEVSSSLALLYGTAAGYNIGDFEGITNQELNGDGTNWLDSVGIPAVAALLPSYEAADWQANLDGMLAVLDNYGR